MAARTDVLQAVFETGPAMSTPIIDPDVTEKPSEISDCPPSTVTITKLEYERLLTAERDVKAAGRHPAWSLPPRRGQAGNSPPNLVD